MKAASPTEIALSTGVTVPLLPSEAVEPVVGFSVAMPDLDLTQGLADQLALARTIQQSLLPKEFPRLPGFGLAGFCRSAGALGGDFYDALVLDEDRVMLVIADVMGTGVPAALFAASLRMLVRSMAEHCPFPSELLTWINQQMFCELSSVDMFITAQLALVDTKRSVLQVASAGHCPFLLATDQGQTQALAPEGLPLGIQSNAQFSDEVVPLDTCACAFLYTDGLTEAVDAKRNLFGQDRLERWLAKHAGQTRSATQIRDKFLHELQCFQGQITTNDDITLIVLARETADVSNLDRRGTNDPMNVPQNSG